MSAVKSVTEFYGSFFVKAAYFSVSPYLLTLAAFVNSREPKPIDLIPGVAACVIFTVVIPVLPWLTSLTFSIAAFAIGVALASMFVAYPVALLLDADSETNWSIHTYN